MKPVTLTCHVPNTVADTVSLFASSEFPKLLAVGQTLIPMLYMRDVLTDNLIGLSRGEGLEGVREESGDIETGAMTRQCGLRRDPVIAYHLPIIPEGSRWIGQVATRGRDTIGGSLNHLDPAAELPAIVAAYGAMLVVQSRRGSRAIIASDWFQGYMAPALEPDDSLVAMIPAACEELYGNFFIEPALRVDPGMNGKANRETTTANICRCTG